MNFFDRVKQPGRYEVPVIEDRRMTGKGRPAWNRGFDQLDPETRARVNAALKASSPVKKGYVYKHSKKYAGKSLLQWATEHDCHHATIKWHFERWGNLDRLKQDYHKKRAKIFWGKTAREWHEFINDPKLTPGHAHGAIKRGKENFENYIFKKTGKKIILQETEEN